MKIYYVELADGDKIEIEADIFIKMSRYDAEQFGITDKEFVTLYNDKFKVVVGFYPWVYNVTYYPD